MGVYDGSTEWNKDRYFTRELKKAFADTHPNDPTQTYLSLLEKATADLGLDYSYRPQFKTAVAYASVCCEEIDWRRVRDELKAGSESVMGRQMRSVHVKVVKRVWDVVQAAAEGRRRRGR